MKRTLLLISIICASTLTLWSQEAGNAVYGRSGRRTSGVTTGNLFAAEPKESAPASFIEANVLMNVKADEYLAVFALAQEGSTLGDASEKAAAQTKEFIAALEKLGVKRDEIFVDFISQNRVYDFAVAENTAKETLSGFEVKKNFAVHYKDRALLENMLSAAAKTSIFDLVKVDYVVTDLATFRERLLEEASRVIRKKEAAYARLFGVKSRPVSVYVEKYNAFFPSEMYSSYAAYGASEVYRGNLPVIGKRKTTTFYFNPLDPGEFDSIVGPSGPEPVVQLTLYLKIKYASS